MAYDLFYRDIKSGDFKSLYILYGQEKLMIDRLLNQFISTVLSKPQCEFNLMKLNGQDLMYEQAISAVERLPILADRQIVIIEGGDFLLDTSWSDDERNHFIDYHAQPIDTITVILANKVDKKRKIFKSISKIGALISFDKLEDTRFIAWCEKEIKRYNKKIDTRTAAYFADGIGYTHKDSTLTLYAVAGKIKQLCDSVKADTIIQSDVEYFVENTVESNIFKFVDAVYEGNLLFAYQQLDALIIAGEAPIKIFSMLHSHIRLLLKIDAIKSIGLSSQAMAECIGLPAKRTFVVNKALKQVRKFGHSKLIELLDQAILCDRLQKTSLDDKLPLEAYIAKTAQILSVKH